MGVEHNKMGQKRMEVKRMYQITVFHDKYYQQVNLQDYQVSNITIGSNEENTITIQTYPLNNDPIYLIKTEHDNTFTIAKNHQELAILKPDTMIDLTIEGIKLQIVFSTQQAKQTVYYIGHLSEIVFSFVKKEETMVPSIDNLIHQDDGRTFFIIKEQGKWFVQISGNTELYINGIKTSGKKELEEGDLLYWSLMTISIKENDLLVIHAIRSFEISLPQTLQPTSEQRLKYPLYQRTPRLVYDLPKDKVNFAFPSQENDWFNRGLWLILLPPVAMLIVMGVVALIQPRGLFIMVSFVMFITTIFTSSVQYFKEKKNLKLNKEKRLKIYTQYLENKRIELQALYDKQRNVLYHHFPSFEQIKYYVSQLSERIWERPVECEDFLHVRIGRAKVPCSYDVSVNSADLSNREVDHLLEQSQEMVDKYKIVKNVPQAINIATGAIGLVGKNSIVKNELQQLIGQLAFFHSYHDIRFIAIFDKQDYTNWEWMKWLPHFQLPGSYARGLIYNEKTRDQLLSSLYEMLRERELDQEKDKKRFIPHFIFIVTNRHLISDHVILEFLEGNQENMGFSTIFAADRKENLFENIHTLVQYVNEREGEIVIEQRKAIHKPFQLDKHYKQGNEEFARSLRALDHQMGMSNSIPTSVSFLELFGIKDVNQLKIIDKWMTNQSAKSLAVPIGLKGKDDLVYLNLHEKAHGPHGLLAGTTGSGKSEFLQTYILSLAVHFHPYEVAFLLIDYKGGGMAQPFKHIPHLLGTITNIEGSKNFSARALASIKSELKRRQRLFDQFEVNHINDYTTLYKEGKADSPLPHLFLISDEFAELKSEEPDFIRELVSAARIGRSLGIHLILATQKPGGIIDNQIWSNSRFKVCLKVQDASDSKEILKNNDAANITVTGRGYLQVGNNEVYELFQSAWSGAPYMVETADGEDEVAIVTDLGLIPLSEIFDQTVTAKKGISEIDAIVEHIEFTTKELQINKLPSPWLPPLQQRISRTDAKSEQEGVFYLGLKDEPDKQLQEHYAYHWIEDGNIVIIGSSGYGKSTTAMTILTSFADRYTPEQLHYYIFDFSNGALLPLQQLPHTADYFLVDDERKIEKFISLLKEEMDRRKNLFRKLGVSSIKLYNTMVEDKLPIIFLTIDNFDLVKEEMDEVEAQFIQFARDGQALGIFMLLTATRANVLRQPLMNSFKTKIVHYLLDQSEQTGVIGKAPYNVEAIPGRALIKKDEIFLTQIYLPADGEDDIEVLDHCKQHVKRLNEKYDNVQKPYAIPMLPTSLNHVEFKKHFILDPKVGLIALGLSEETVTPVFMDLNKSKHCLIIGQTQKGKSNILKIIIDSLSVQSIEAIGLFDSIDRSLSRFSQLDNSTYIETKEQITNWTSHVEELLKKRNEQYLQAISLGNALEFQFPPIVLIIDGISRFLQTADNILLDQISSFMKHYSHLGFSIIVSGNVNEITKGYDSLTSEIKQIRQAIILMKKSEQNILNTTYVRKEPDIQPGFGHYISDGQEVKIQIPLYL